MITLNHLPADLHRVETDVKMKRYNLSHSPTYHDSRFQTPHSGFPNAPLSKLNYQHQYMLESNQLNMVPWYHLLYTCSWWPHSQHALTWSEPTISPILHPSFSFRFCG